MRGALLETLGAIAGRDECGFEDDAAGDKHSGDEGVDEKTVVEDAVDKEDVVVIPNYSVCAWAYVVIESTNTDPQFAKRRSSCY